MRADTLIFDTRFADADYYAAIILLERRHAAAAAAPPAAAAASAASMPMPPVLFCFFAYIAELRFSPHYAFAFHAAAAAISGRRGFSCC